MHTSWSPHRVENPEQHEIHALNVSVSEWGSQGHFICNNARLDVSDSCSESISWRKGGLLVSVTQICDVSGESLLHTIHWRLMFASLSL